MTQDHSRREFEIHGATERQAQELRAMPEAIPAHTDDAKRLAYEIASAYAGRPAGKFSFAPPMPSQEEMQSAREAMQAASLALDTKRAEVEAKKRMSKKAAREALRPFVACFEREAKRLSDLESQAALHLSSAEHLRAVEQQVAILTGSVDADWVVNCEGERKDLGRGLLSSHSLRGVLRVPMKDGQTLRLAVVTMVEYGVIEYINIGPCPTHHSFDGMTDRQIATNLTFGTVRPFYTLRQCQSYHEKEQAWGLDIQPVSLAPSDIDALVAATHLAAGWAKALHHALIPSLSWLFELGYRMLDGRESVIPYTSRRHAEIEEVKP